MLSFFFRQGRLASQVMTQQSSLSSARVFTEKEIFESILGNTKTEVLKVSDYPHMLTITNHLKSPVWPVLRHYAHLDLSFVNLSNTPFSLPVNDNLESIIFYRNRLEKLDSVVSVLRRCSSLVNLDLSGNSFGNPDALSALAALCQLGFLETLSLANTNLSKAGHHALSHLIAGSALTKLNLHATELRVEQVSHLINSLASHQTLEALDLSFNPAVEPLLVPLIQTLTQNASMPIHSINLMGCGKLTPSLWQSALELVNASETISNIILPDGSDESANEKLNDILKQRQRVVLKPVDTCMPLPSKRVIDGHDDLSAFKP